MKIFKSRALMGEDTIGIRRAIHRVTTPEHTHDYIEIVYVTRGKALEYVDGVKYEVSRGDMLFMTPNSIHSFEPLENYEKIEVFFSTSLIGNAVSTTGDKLAMLALSSFNDMRASKSYGLIRLSGNDITEAEFLLGIMEKEFKSKKKCYEELMCGCLNILLIKMIRGSENERKSVFSMVARYIDENFDKPLSLSALSAKCFYNPSYFSRIFKEKFGSSLTDYIKRKRIEESKRLLLSSELNVDEISRRVGFTDKSAFYRAFYEETEKTPAKYRLEVKK